MYLTKRMIFEEIKNAINESFGVNKNIVAIINDLMEDINEYGIATEDNKPIKK